MQPPVQPCAPSISPYVTNHRIPRREEHKTGSARQPWMQCLRGKQSRCQPKCRATHDENADYSFAIALRQEGARTRECDEFRTSARIFNTTRKGLFGYSVPLNRTTANHQSGRKLLEGERRHWINGSVRTCVLYTQAWQQQRGLQWQFYSKEVVTVTRCDLSADRNHSTLFIAIAAIASARRVVHSQLSLWSKGPQQSSAEKPASMKSLQIQAIR